MRISLNTFPFFLWLLPSLLYSFSTAIGQSLEYPEARRSEHVDIYHGVSVPDPYQWMEDMDSNETVKWMEAQQQLLNNYLDKSPARDRLKSRIKEYQNISSYGLPVKRGGNYFFTETPPQTSQPILYMQEAGDNQAKKLFDPEKEFQSDIRRLRSFSVSPDGRYLAYATSRNVSRWRTVGLMEIETGRILTDALKGFHSTVPALAWTPDGAGFYYARFELPEDEDPLNVAVEAPRIFYHKVGTDQSEDKLVYEEPSNLKRVFSPRVSEDGKFLIITAREGSASHNEILYKEIDNPGTVKKLRTEAKGIYTFLGNEGSSWWFYTTAGAPNGRIISLDIAAPSEEYWNEIVPEDARAAIAGGSRAGGNALGMYGGKLVIMYLKGVRRSIRVFSSQGEFLYRVELPDTGSVWGGFSGRQNDNELFYRFLGLNYPRLVYRLDLSSGKNELFKSPELNLNPDKYETIIAHYKSKDGTRVPMFVTRKRGVKKDGSHPVFMYGYGAFGWVSFPWYQPQILTWLEMGGIYAIPAIRGGGEYGEEWHEAGIGTSRQNAIDDYIAAAEWFVEEGYSIPEKLVANGGSASGMVAAAAVLQRPDLFGAALIDIPALDMLRYHKFTAAGFWIQEFGSVENKEEFEALYGYSPYHNIRRGQCYPATLVTVGENDQTTVPMHGYKYVAALQYAQSCNRPALLKVVEGAGHRFGKTPDQQAGTWADQLAFLVKVLKLNPKSE